jgi:uncharacterized membrane protein YhaH (DUF805 family)
MGAIKFPLSPQGRLRPQPFLIGVALVYLAGAASHWLTLPDVTARIGLWPFATAQAMLTWLWLTLHAKRLHDAARGPGLAIAVALLYVLSLVLLLILAANFLTGAENTLGNKNATSALELILLLYVVMTLAGSLHYDLTSVVVSILTLCALAPIVIALVFTIWAATRPSTAQPSTAQP